MSAMTIPTAGPAYLKLVQRFPLRPIRGDVEYRIASWVSADLASREALAEDENDYRLALDALLAAYVPPAPQPLPTPTPEPVVVPETPQAEPMRPTSGSANCGGILFKAAAPKPAAKAAAKPAAKPAPKPQPQPAAKKRVGRPASIPVGKKLSPATKRLREYVTKSTIKQGDIAAQAKVSESTLSAILHGRMKIKHDYAVAFGRIFQVDPKEFTDAQQAQAA